MKKLSRKRNGDESENDRIAATAKGALEHTIVWKVIFGLVFAAGGYGIYLYQAKRKREMIEDERGRSPQLNGQTTVDASVSERQGTGKSISVSSNSQRSLNTERTPSSISFGNIITGSNDSENQVIRLLDQVNSEITANSLGNSERLLVDAVRICQSSSCSNPLKALIQVWIGFIHFVKGQNDLARNDIVSAKRLDPYIVLESSFFSPRFLEFFDSISG